ncbi:MAG: hypothetical protein EPN33_14080 [Acidobacteria bacterium]|nr:MAG: hypothetical protein EPN33_14080 [Acidobacteriota bacterium]
MAQKQKKTMLLDAKLLDVARHFLPWSLPMVAWSAGFDSRQGPPAGAQGSSKLPPEVRRALGVRTETEAVTRLPRIALITSNLDDFRRLRRELAVEFVAPFPR